MNLEEWKRHSQVRAFLESLGEEKRRGLAQLLVDVQEDEVTRERHLAEEELNEIDESLAEAKRVLIDFTERHIGDDKVETVIGAFLGLSTLLNTFRRELEDGAY